MAETATGEWRIVGAGVAPERLGAIPAGVAWVPFQRPLPPPAEIPIELYLEARMMTCLVGLTMELGLRQKCRLLDSAQELLRQELLRALGVPVLEGAP